MKLKLHELKDPITLSCSQEDGWLRDVFTHLNLSFESPMSLGLQITQDKEVIFVQGHLKMALKLPCSRCAEDMEYKVDDFFSPAFVHGKDPHGQDQDLSSDDLDVTYFEKDEIDIGEIVEEQVGLLLPIKPLCSEQCQGLCSLCGQNLNLGLCLCKKEVPISPFHVLKDFKAKKVKKKKRS